MTDAFDFTTSRQRRVVMGTLLVYIALVAVSWATASELAAAGANLVLAALAVPGGLVVARRVLDAPDTDPVVLGSAAAFVVAGVAIGYEGLADLGAAPTVDQVQPVGTFALLIALVLYFLARR